MKSLSVISDIHIQSAKDPAYATLLRLMRERLEPGATFVLAGDVFDFLMGGPPKFAEEYAEFFSVFAELREKGIDVHYIEGNHDFHLAPFLKDHPNVKLHHDAVDLEIGGKKFHIAHGDLIDREDYGYRLLRGVLRSRVISYGAKIVPEKIVFKVGEKHSVATKGLRRGDDPRTERTRRLFRNYALSKFVKGFDFVILGHSHDYDEERIQLADHQGQYMNVGYPKAHRTYVYWDEEEMKLVRKGFV